MLKHTNKKKYCNQVIVNKITDNNNGNMTYLASYIKNFTYYNLYVQNKRSSLRAELYGY